MNVCMINCFLGINNDEWQEKIIEQHPCATATLDQVEAAACIPEQVSIQGKQMTFLQRNTIKTENSYVNRVISNTTDTTV